MAEVAHIPLRSEVSASDTWNLASLFPGEAAWESSLADFEAMTAKVPGYKGSLGRSSDSLASALEFYRDFGILDERLGIYASLRQCEDQGDDASRGRFSRYLAAATRAQAAWSWFEPELQTLDTSFIEACLAEARFAEYAVFVRKLLRWKPYILSEREERLLALQAQSAGVASDAFSVLTDVDLDFGSVETPEGLKPLSQSSWSAFMRSPDRELRGRVYRQFYKGFDTHKNTLSALYSGSVLRDKYKAQVRGFPSALAAALFPDKVDESVYTNLIATVSDNLPLLHDYYEIRRRALKVDELRHYDVYVPLVQEAKSRHSYSEAIGIVSAALAPLGEEYVSTLRSGLEGGWVDRYENKGKDSGAFSSGSYTGDPYILLNYKEDVLHDLFTIAHEGGHSMHSHYSAASNPFLSYSYTIFEAEVASTFNEQMVFRYLYDRAGSDAEKASLVSAKVDDLVSTLFRQTMFAEFELRTHQMAEADEPLTVDALRSEYRKLLVKYFGKALRFEDTSDLEGLRIPHFYRAFYVYKYATGISASIALSERVLAGGQTQREDYFAFLKSGGSRFPIESLKVAGVDMSSPAPVASACAVFGHWVSELKRVLAL